MLLRFVVLLLLILSGASNSVQAQGVGSPQIAGAVVCKGHDVQGNYFVDLQLTNTGNGHARDLRVNSVVLRTLNGTGTVTLNTALSPALPHTIGDLDAGASVTRRFYVNFPATVTRFAITESLSLMDMSGSTLSASLSQSVFTFASSPVITGLSPASGHVGDSILINGRDFGPTQGSSTVAFNGTQATPASWSTCQIVAPVPSGATTGNVVVTVGGSTASGVNFTVLEPILTAIAVLPPNPIVSKGASQLFMALGTLSDSSTQDLSTSATWSSSNTGVATVDTAGLASATNAG